jgi:hypothetical protein
MTAETTNFQSCDGQDGLTDQPKSETKLLSCGAAKGGEGLVPADRKRARRIDKELNASRDKQSVMGMRCKTVAGVSLPV